MLTLVDAQPCNILPVEIAVTADGVNMNLVRNHIIYWYNLLDEKLGAGIQTSLFDNSTGESLRRPVPPKVPDQYMVAGCKYSDRLNGRFLERPHFVQLPVLGNMCRSTK